MEENINNFNDDFLIEQNEIDESFKDYFKEKYSLSTKEDEINDVYADYFIEQLNYTPKKTNKPIVIQHPATGKTYLMRLC